MQSSWQGLCSELYSAKQYYVEGETFTPEGGILKVYSYNEKTKEEKYRFVDLTASFLPFRTAHF